MQDQDTPHQFSRSLRQQSIINAVLQKLKDQGITNLTKAKSLL